MRKGLRVVDEYWQSMNTVVECTFLLNMCQGLHLGHYPLHYGGIHHFEREICIRIGRRRVPRWVSRGIQHHTEANLVR